MRLGKVAFPAFMLATSLYFLLPTTDEILIHPAFGFFLSHSLNLPFVYGVFLSIVIYRSVGLVCLLASSITGGKTIYHTLKETITQKLNK